MQTEYIFLAFYTAHVTCHKTVILLHRGSSDHTIIQEILKQQRVINSKLPNVFRGNLVKR